MRAVRVQGCSPCVLKLVTFSKGVAWINKGLCLRCGRCSR